LTHRLFISYSHNDKRRLERLHKHLAQLQREGSVAAWYDREISAGGNIDHEITTELAAADIFVAALSPDFIASSYCIDVELEHALERELSGELTIVPVIFEPCDWLNTKLGKFKAIPDDGKPVSEFTNENVAFLTVVNELRKLVSRPKIGSKKSLHIETSSKTDAIEVSPTNRYRVKKDFDALHKRDFVEKSFKEIFEFFRSSIAEISLVNEIEARLSDLGNDHFE
jgi:TIR domain